MSAPPTRLYLRTRRAVARLQRLAERQPAAASGTAEPVEAMGLRFSTPVGLAAGFDRDGRLRGVGHRLGFGAVEVGTRTADSGPLAIVRPTRGDANGGLVCGVSIGKRPATPWVRAESDFLEAMRRFHGAADYLTLNPGRDRPPPERFVRLVASVAAARGGLLRDRPLPIVVKLPSAWLPPGERAALAVSFVAAGAAGLLVSAEGAPSVRAALQTLADVAAAVGRQVCLISVGGIVSPRAAHARMRAGADLVQVHRAASVSGGSWFSQPGGAPLELDPRASPQPLPPSPAATSARHCARRRYPQLTRCMAIPTA